MLIGISCAEVNEMEGSNKNHLKRKIIDISQRCGAQGWCPGTLGNISVLNSKLRVYIKRSGADLNRLELGDILTLNLEGEHPRR